MFSSEIQLRFSEIYVSMSVTLTVTALRETESGGSDLPALGLVGGTPHIPVRKSYIL